MDEQEIASQSFKVWGQLVRWFEEHDKGRLWELKYENADQTLAIFRDDIKIWTVYILREPERGTVEVFMLNECTGEIVHNRHTVWDPY